jgi:hypothetical protein
MNRKHTETPLSEAQRGFLSSFINANLSALLLMCKSVNGKQADELLQVVMIALCRHAARGTLATAPTARGHDSVTFRGREVESVRSLLNRFVRLSNRAVIRSTGIRVERRLGQAKEFVDQIGTTSPSFSEVSVTRVLEFMNQLPRRQARQFAALALGERDVAEEPDALHLFDRVRQAVGAELSRGTGCRSGRCRR